MLETASLRQQPRPQRMKHFNWLHKSMFSVGFSLLLTADFHMEILSQVEAHLPPRLAPAPSHNTPPKKQAIKLLPLLSHARFQDWCRISSDRLWTRSATMAFHLEVSAWHIEVFGIPEVWLSAQLHNLSRDNLLITGRERRMSTDNPFYVRGHLLPHHVPAEAPLPCHRLVCFFLKLVDYNS